MNEYALNFLEKCNIKYNFKFKYDLSDYKGMKFKIKIECPIHGKFEQIGLSHLYNIHGCPKCGFINIGNKLRENTENFIIKAKKVHGDIYDYSKVKYIKASEKVIIICPTHNEFLMSPNNHLGGQKCGFCKGETISNNQRMTLEYFIKLSKEKHGDKYDYSKVEYKNCKEKIIIICPEHGEFKQIAGNHCYKGRGCSKCKNSKGEKEVSLILDSLNIKYEQQKSFPGLIFERSLYFDFYLPEYNLVIEYDGKHHYIPIEQFGGIDYFENIIKRDVIKNEYCSKNNIHLLRKKYDVKNIKDNIIDKLNIFDNKKII